MQSIFCVLRIPVGSGCLSLSYLLNVRVVSGDFHLLAMATCLDQVLSKNLLTWVLTPEPSGLN